ncbi:MAG: DIP1984 family protein [Anaerolineae bacterium]|nr:DIP1984 family protein [Anaerolineae bacterium]
MKLAEALILRADAQKRIQQLRERLNRSAKVQEGEQPPEDPQELLAELDRAIVEFSVLVKQINRTNAQTAFGEGQTLTDVLADRDALALQRSVLAGVIQNAAVQQNRYSRSEVKYFSTVSIAALQKQVDALARQYRELDSQIQQLNWQVDLIE